MNGAAGGVPRNRLKMRQFWLTGRGWMTLGGPLESPREWKGWKDAPKREALGCIVVEFRILRWELRFNLKEE
jgi:hypothetical protein